LFFRNKKLDELLHFAEGIKIKKNEVKIMKKFQCTICGYIYDPKENGDVEFENLASDWVCPECGVGKDMFEEVK